MGTYAFLFYLCLLSPILSLKTPSYLMSWAQMFSEELDTDMGKPYDIDIEVIEIRSDGVRFEWNLTGAWYDTYSFNISLTSLRNNTLTPWYKNCSDHYYCMQGPCQRDTNNIGKCDSVEACETAIVTVTGGDIPEGRSSANIIITTGPSSGKILKGRTTPDYTPNLNLETNSDGTVIVSWIGPPLNSLSRCAHKVLINTLVDGKVNKNRDIIQDVNFSNINSAAIMPSGLSQDKESLVKITVAYMVKENGVYKATDVLGSASVKTKIGNGGQMLSSSSSFLVLATCACIMLQVMIVLPFLTGIE